MKKLVTILLTSFLMILMTGCKNDKILTCTSNTKDIYGYFTIEDIYVLQFDNNGKHLIGFKEEENFIYGPAITNEDKKDVINQLEEQYDVYSKMRGVSCKLNITDEYIHTYVKVMTSELDKENREKFHVDDNYDEWKERLSDEYICE